MKRIVITGGIGFIGANLIQRLKGEYKLLVLDAGLIGDGNLQYIKQDIEYIKLNLLDKEKVASYLKSSDIIIHLAAKGNVVESVEDPMSNFNCNVLSTLSLLEAMREINCSKIIFSSTGGALMGNAPPPVNEKTCPSPISPYGASKLSCEGYISAYSSSYGFDAFILRFGNVYGPYSSHKKGVINKFIKKIISGQSLDVFGSLDTSRDYIHVKDICQGINLCVDKFLNETHTGLEKFHLANGEEVTLKKIIEKLKIITKKNINYNISPQRIGEVKRNSSDYSKAKEILGFIPMIKLEDGLSELYSWILNNP